MKHRTQNFIYIALLLFSTVCAAESRVYHAIGTAEGLSNNSVYHILQLNDGQIAVTNRESIDLWNGSSFSHIKKSEKSATPLPGYRGAYHVYTDKNNNLWVKDFRKVWCFDKNHRQIKDCVPEGKNDMFVDDGGNVFFISQDSLNPMLDLKTMNGLRYEFFADGTVHAFDKEKELYSSKAILDSAAVTSLVISDTVRGKFYQLIDQKLCLEFDTKNRRWTEIFRSSKLHTISMTDAVTAVIVSHDGMWEINLDSRKAEHVDQVMMDDGCFVSSSRLNTIFTDSKGTIWIGSADYGLLRSTDEQKSGMVLYIVLIGTVACFICVSLFLYLYKNKKKNVDSKEETTLQVTVDQELIDKATELVKKNLATPNYTVERLAQDLCMDRTGLYKKLTSMLGVTPTAFIRKIRVEHAASLIRDTDMSMTDVATQAGFSSPSYMAKCFQEDLGIRPTDLKK